VKHFSHLLLSGSPAGDSQGPAALCWLHTPAEPHYSIHFLKTNSSFLFQFKYCPVFFHVLPSFLEGSSPSRLYYFALFRSQTHVHSCSHVTFSPLPNHGALPPYWLSPTAQTTPSYATKPLSVQTQTFILPKLFNLKSIWCHLRLSLTHFICSNSATDWQTQTCATTKFPPTISSWLVGWLVPQRGSAKLLDTKIPNIRLIRGHKSPMCLDTSMDWPAETDTDFVRCRIISNLEHEDSRFLHRAGNLSQTTWRHMPKFTKARTRIIVLNCTAESLHAAPQALELYWKWKIL